MTTASEDNARKAHAAMSDAEFDRKAEKMLAGHREAPDGRNIFSFKMRNLDNDGYKGRFDNTFQEAPGSKKRMAKEFCLRCGKRKHFCACKEECPRCGSKKLLDGFGELVALPNRRACPKCHLLFDLK